MKPWKIVDVHGDTVIDADTFTRDARVRRTTPRKLAQQEARRLANDVDPPLFAVPA